MKMKVFTVLVVALLALPLVASGCSGGSVETTEDFDDFTRLDIQNAFDVEIVQSGNFSIVISSSKDLVDYLDVTRHADTLTMKLTPNHPFTDFVLMRKVLKAKINMPALRGLALSGASRATVRGFESSDAIDLDVSGASTVALDDIETGDASIGVSGASSMTGKLKAGTVVFDVSGASRVEIYGASGSVQVNGSGASKLNLEGFVNESATVTLSGATQLTIDARDRLDFSLSGASRLYFLSNPKVGKMEVLGASTVKHQ